MTPGLLAADERLLILGGGGWFGRTLRTMVGSSVPVLATASSARLGLETFSEARIRDFAPTMVANFAFLTRERIESDGVDAFTRTNRLLTEQFLWVLELPSVRSAVTVSSGAAVTESDLPYGQLKRQEEMQALERASDSLAVCIARAYSVSGPFVRRPHDYAFSDLILQAAEGVVPIRAAQPTFRRYIAVDDYLAVCLASVRQRLSGVIESGGELVEMGDLAQAVVTIVNPAATVTRVRLTSAVPAVYASDNTSWTSAVELARLAVKELPDQIRATAAGLQDHA